MSEIHTTSDGYSIENMNKVPQSDKRIRLIKPVVVKGHPGVTVGQIFTVSGPLAHELTVCGWAEEAPELPVVGNAVSEIQTREPEPENREPEVAPQKPLDKSLKRKTPKTDS